MEAPSPFFATFPKSRISLDMEDLLLFAAGVAGVAGVFVLVEGVLGAGDSGVSFPS
jgi:hypothetical protein